MVVNHLYRDPSGVTHDIAPGQVHTWSYEEVGRTYYQDGQLRCEGGMFRGAPDFVVTVHQRFKLVTDTIVGDKQQISAPGLGLKLKCDIQAGECLTDEGTFIWDLPVAEECPLARNKNFHGIEAIDNEGKTVVMSTDGNLVRVIKGEPVSLCDRVVYSTNYPDLYLYPLTGERPFHRHIHPEEVSITMYINNRDDYLYHHLLETVKDEFQKTLTNDCHQKKETNQMRTWLQHTDPKLATWTLGGGTFATAAGEVLYTYACRPMLVKAVQTDRCFQSLPVRPLSHFDLVSDLWFLEPLTHRLTKQGVPVPCSLQFAPKYQDYSGKWLTATPQIHEAKPPNRPDRVPHRNLELQGQLDWSRGGIYEQQELRDMETYLDFSRRRDALTYKMLEQASSDRQLDIWKPLRLESMFPGTQVLNPSFMHTLWTKILGFLHTWGDGAAIFLSTYLICRTIWALTTWFHRTVVLYRLRGCNFTTFFYSLCDHCLVIQGYKDRHARREEEVERAFPQQEQPKVGMVPMKRDHHGSTLPRSVSRWDWLKKLEPLDIPSVPSGTVSPTDSGMAPQPGGIGLRDGATRPGGP